jgi:shikimate kinase
MPGSGKSTIGKELAENLGRKFFDLDKEIERMAGWEIPDIFAQVGEDYFRELEKSVLFMLIRLNEPSVISTGGGTPCFYDNMAMMNMAGPTFFLDTPLEDLITRVKKDKASRPLVNKMSDDNMTDDMQSLYKKRISDYKKAAFTTQSDLGEILNHLKSMSK